MRKAAAGKEKGRVPLAETSRTLPLTGRGLQCLKWPMVHYNMELMKLSVELHVKKSGHAKARKLTLCDI